MSNKPTNQDQLLTKHYNKPYNVYRRAKLIMLSSVLKEHDVMLHMSINDRFELVEKIERGCFNYTITHTTEQNIPTSWKNDIFKDVYNSTCAKIYANLSTTNNVNNDYLLPCILENKINCNDLPKLTSQQLFPDKYKDVIVKLETSKNVQWTVKTSSMYRCRRCKKNECTIENRYNRSLDEGVNLTITCVACGNEWNA